MSATRGVDDLRLAHYPRTNTYDPMWALENRMGPSVLWLVESLAPHLSLEPGMHVLDLGCGKAISSIFLAREFGCRITAADLWIDPGDNRRRIRDAGQDALVTPIHCKAPRLPFADEAFDAILSFDAYHYFGNDPAATPVIARMLRPGGTLGLVVPGLTAELDAVPEWLAPFWDEEFWTFHSPGWWADHLARDGVFTVEHADMIPDGWREWLLWDEVTHALERDGSLEPIFALTDGSDPVVRGIEMLRADAGRTLGFTRVVATRPA